MFSIWGIEVKLIYMSIAAIAVATLSTVSFAVCDGYNSGGKIDCYAIASDIPVQGKAVPKLASLEAIIKAHMIAKPT